MRQHKYVLVGLLNNIFASRYVFSIPNKLELLVQAGAVLEEWNKTV